MVLIPIVVVAVVVVVVWLLFVVVVFTIVLDYNCVKSRVSSGLEKLSGFL